MRRAISITILGAVIAVGVATYAVAFQSQKSHIVLAQGADRRPSRTASDWVTYADHVVVVTAVAEKALPPMRQDVEHGEGAILRDVTLQVDDVLWSSGGAARPAPASFDWTAYGWTFRGGNPDNRTEMAGADEPRIEKGHTYIMAIEWQPPRCTPGDFVPAQWRGLGDGSTLPFDDKTIGNGEMEGHDQSVEQARSAADTSDPNYGLKDRMAGGSADALAKALGSATPQARKEFDPPLSQTSCG